MKRKKILKKIKIRFKVHRLILYVYLNLFFLYYRWTNKLKIRKILIIFSFFIFSSIKLNMRKSFFLIFFSHIIFWVLFVT